MSGDLTKPLTGNTALTANYIQSLNTNGFTVGTDARVNSNGIIYHWIAFKAGAGEMKVGTYQGNGGTNTICGVGFKADMAFIMSADANEAVIVHPIGFMPTTNFANGIVFYPTVSPLTDDCFTLNSTDVRVNNNGTTYHYFALKQVDSLWKTITYEGNGSDNRDFTGFGFRPYYVMLRAYLATYYTVFHSGTMGFSTDASLQYNNTSTLTNNIQALLPDGFQVGTHNNTNRSSSPTTWYDAVAFNLSYQRP